MADKNYSRYINEAQIKSLVDDIHTFVQAEDTSLKDKVKNELQREVNARISADSKLNEKLNNETKARLTNIKDLNDKIDTEITRAQNVEGNLNELKSDDKTSLVNAINYEIERAKNVENGLNDKIEDEITRAQGAEGNLENVSSLIKDANIAKGRDLNIANLITTSSELDVKLSSEDTQTITGGLNIDTVNISNGANILGDLAIQGNLNVKGTSTTINSETLTVKDNLIVTNSEGTTLTTNDSGLAIRKNTNDAYGIVYNPIDDSVNLGLGTIDEYNKNFQFKNGEGLPIVVRDNLIDGNFPIYSKDGCKLIDSEISKTNYEDKVKRLEDAESDINDLNTNLEAEIKRAKDKEEELSGDISDEIERAEGVESNLNTRIETEENRAKDEESRIEKRLETEENRAKNVEKDLYDKLAEETERAQGIEGNLDELKVKSTEPNLVSAINAEYDRAVKEENDIRSEFAESIESLQNGLNNNVIFTREPSAITTIALGGLPKNTNIQGKSLVSILSSILFPYVAFSNVALTLNPSAGTFYKGESIVLDKFTPKWTSGSETINSIILKQGSTQLYNNTNVTNSSEININDLTINSNTTFTLTLSDGTTTLNAYANYSFVDPEYYGVTSQENIDKILAGNVTTNNLDNWLTKTKNIPSSVALNANMSCPIFISTNTYSSIKDANGFENINIFSMSEITLNRVNYYVYVASPSTGSYTYKLS